MDCYATFKLQLRSQRDDPQDSGQVRAVQQDAEWNACETAVIICDMWNRHWCRGATARSTEMAARMNKLTRYLRNAGALVVHAPSDTMAFYASHPGRVAILQLKEKYRNSGEPHLRQVAEGPFPIDDSDGGCACTPPCSYYQAWSHQIDTIAISDADYITDQNDIFILFKEKGIKNALVMGVHTNMCILGRPFAIRSLVRRGYRTALVRDLTDSMYNPAMPPHVDHFTGTDLVIRHIERYWCPTVTSDQFLGGSPFRFNDDLRSDPGQDLK